MVTVTFRKDSHKRLSSVFASGHAGWSQSGSDVVCAAVSAILQAARLGLEVVAHVPLHVRQEAGTIDLSWDESRRNDPALEVILRTAELSLTQIATQYPDHLLVVIAPQS